MSTAHIDDAATTSPEERLHLAVKEYQDAMAMDSPPPCELAGLELNAKDRVLNCVEHLTKECWAITATIERAVP